MPETPADREMVSLFKEELSDISTRDDNDVIRWRWDSGGNYSVKSLYIFLQDGGVADTRFVQLWKVRTPLKVRTFVWLVLRKRVLTADLLVKRCGVGRGGVFSAWMGAKRWNTSS